MSALDELTLRKVNDFVDDDLLSCFLWAAGENAVAQPGWESPSVNPLGHSTPTDDAAAASSSSSCNTQSTCQHLRIPEQVQPGGGKMRTVRACCPPLVAALESTTQQREQVTLGLGLMNSERLATSGTMILKTSPRWLCRKPRSRN